MLHELFRFLRGCLTVLAQTALAFGVGAGFAWAIKNLGDWLGFLTD